MNGWVLAGLVLVFLAIIASIALWTYDKFSQIEAEKTAFNQAADKAEHALRDLVAERNQAIAERNALRLQLDEALKPRTRAKPTAKPKEAP